MAYNLQSLTQVLEQTLHPELHQQLWEVDDDHDKPQLESLLKLAHSLEEILDIFPQAGYNKITEALMIQIRDASYVAEDIIESYVAKQILTHHGGGHRFITRPMFFLESWSKNLFHKRKESLNLRRAFVPLLFAIEKLIKMVDQNVRILFVSHPSIDNVVSKSSVPGASLLPTSSAQDIVVGLENDLLRLKERMIGQGTKLEVIPIVGMGGIGKTTLAHHLYNDPLIRYHFDICIWATVSQEYNLRAILLSLVDNITRNGNVEMLGKGMDQLAETMYKGLSGKRYLVVLDDIWSTNFWDDIQRLFPHNNNNGSCIVLTTRELSVASYANSMSPHHQMNLLNEAESWNLLREKVFGKENCPPELEDLGRNIANNCKGLPLAIQVIGGILLKTQKSKDFWRHIAADVRAAVAKNAERFTKILSLSYDHLPLHLRPCFLYMGGFPEDYEIQASKITRLFVAEGFLKPIEDKTSEEAAEEYLKALVDRSLLLVRGRSLMGKVKSYSIHDLVRDLCKRKGEREKFINVYKGDMFGFPSVDDLEALPEAQTHSKRRVIVHPNFFCNVQISMNTRSFIHLPPGTHSTYGYELRKFGLLRVLDLLTKETEKFPKEILQLVNIRYLALTCRSGLPSSISRLWNLQTLIFEVPMRSSPLVIQTQLRRLTEIRHIKFKRSCFYSIDSDNEQYVLENLQTLSYVDAYKFTKSGFIEKVPNLKKLGMRLDSPGDIVDISGLLKLETLNCLCGFFKDRTTVAGIIFPPSIRKLCLTFCKVTETFMSSVGSLPNLKVLKILDCTMLGESTWEPTEGEFVSLQFLQLDGFDLLHWRADETHYPRLRHLVIRRCYTLTKIPRGIGDIPTMEVIELSGASGSIVASVKGIQEEQCELGNDGLQVLTREVPSSWWEKFV